MAKLGMPSVNIAFIEAGIEAIKRSQRGIVALLLEEDADTVTKLLTDHTAADGKTTIKAIKNPFVVYTTDDIPDELSDDNKDYITKTLIGYVKAPYRVKVYMMNKVTEESANASADKFADALKTLATDRWDYLAIPTIATAQCESVATWLKTNRENKGKRSKVVLPGYAADYEGVINFSNTKIVTASKTYTGAQYTPRIAGLIAGTPLTISATYAPLSEVIDCDRYTADENDEKVNNGEFFVWFDGEKFKMSRAMNSLVTTTQSKLEAYQTIKSVDIMDAIYDDIKKTAQDSYIGKYTNDYDNKQLLISAIMGYFKELEDGRLLQKDYSEVDINVEKVKNYQLQHGLYTKEELADMDDLTIKKLDTKKQVLLTAKIKILDAMEDIDLPINI
ncbi:phage tail sheath subtilisin-like domain-containing protein [Allisonella histaminiformans]|uniref:phage tail sheath subtilisin-like domain-containing protein n=1 Tax=Allisonella histaminiformans TaxID=209880 RepID=UPI002E77A524|nr:phage tail sheath subtilisin-like domain-containing protein [Allisonella histaminiformans]